MLYLAVMCVHSTPLALLLPSTTTASCCVNQHVVKQTCPHSEGAAATLNWDAARMGRLLWRPKVLLALAPLRLVGRHKADIAVLMFTKSDLSTVVYPGSEGMSVLVLLRSSTNGQEGL